MEQFEDTFEWLERRARDCERLSHEEPDQAVAFTESALRYKHHANHVRLLRETLRALVDQVKLCGKESAGIFQIAALHGCEYRGPNWVTELAVAESVLAELPESKG